MTSLEQQRAAGAPVSVSARIGLLGYRRFVWMLADDRVALFLDDHVLDVVGSRG
jgi:hypothetical protein